MHVAIAVYFAANSMVQLYAREGAPPASAEDQGDNKLLALIGAREPVLTPSIYLLVYDSYVVNETMSAYGFATGSKSSISRIWASRSIHAPTPWELCRLPR
jgi:hypothetical protein